MQAADLSSTATATVAVTAAPRSSVETVVEEQPAYNNSNSITNSGTVSIVKSETAQDPVALATLDLLLLMGAPPGSYSHCALAMTHLSHLQETLGEGHPRTQQALTVAIDAHVARYGETEPVVRARLMAAHPAGQAALTALVTTAGVTPRESGSMRSSSAVMAVLSAVSRWLGLLR